MVCPWCYIGKRRFEAGLEIVKSEDLGVDFEISYHPYQLDPTAPPGATEPVLQAYAKKFGGAEQAGEMIARVTQMADAAGLDFNMDVALRANTLLAHRLLWLAGQVETAVSQEAMKERLLRAYFTDGLNIGDPEVLADCAADVGFERQSVINFFESDRGANDVAAELAQAQNSGITAVPTYVVNGAWAIPGAQEPETFAQVLRKIASEATADA